MRRSDSSSARAALSGREVFFLTLFIGAAALVAIPWLVSKVHRRDRLASYQNLQQWGIALNLYLIDNDNRLPRVGNLPIGPQPDDAWYNVLPTYLSQQALGALPPGKRPTFGDGTIWFDPGADPPRRPAAGEFYFTYGMNRYLQPDAARMSLTVYDLEAPGHTVFLTEKSGFTPGVVPGEMEFRQKKKDAGDALLAFVLFCDGHVSFGSQWELRQNPEAAKPDKTLSPLSWAPYVGAPAPKAAD